MTDWNPYPEELRIVNGGMLEEAMADLRETVDRAEEAAKRDDIDGLIDALADLNRMGVFGAMAFMSLRERRAEYIRNISHNN